MVTSRTGAKRPVLHDHHSSVAGSRFQPEQPIVSPTSDGLQALEDAERSLADLRLLLSDVKDAVLATLDATSFALADPHSQARRELLARHKRNTLLSKSLFFDPAWDILLLLFSECREHESMVAGELAVRTAIPLTTTLRWIATMEVKDLVWRRTNKADRRAVDVGLTARGIELMLTYFAR